MAYSYVHDQAVFNQAFALCRGSFQRNLCMGYDALSGATLRGKAKEYIGDYRRSGENFIARCQAHGLKVEERIGDHNRREIHFG